jgi:hypothetical protein
VELGRAYVKDKQRSLHPEWPLSRRLAKAGHSSRSGDLGEVLAAALYRRRLGAHVPFRKLQLKPQGNATVQSSDVLALFPDGPDFAPVTIEVKGRVSPAVPSLLRELRNSAEIVSEDYLREAWVTGVSLMDDHPDHQRHFALSAAYHLAQLQEPDRRQRPHARHAVLVLGSDNVTSDKAVEAFGDRPPISELHVVLVPGMREFRDSVFEVAGRLKFGDLADGVPRLLAAERPTPGVTAPASSEEAARVARATLPRRFATVVETALWYLADWDGLGLARAKDGAAHPDPLVRGLCDILAGAEGRGAATLAGTSLSKFGDAAKRAIRLELGEDTFARQAGECAALIADPEEDQAARYTAAALLHRLPRHPLTMAAAKGADGPTVRYVVDQLTTVGRYALWPSQAAAVEGGLLDSGQPSLAVKMPTSAGKTALIQLVAAQSLDAPGEPTVAVLAPTKALVSQLTRDLRTVLPDGIPVTSSHGGLDYDIAGPQAGDVLSPGTVTVMTPERFDLEWRRAATEEDHPGLDHLRLLIVDEAHLIHQRTRGASLELGIARALRHGVRVVLLSSQFSDLEQIQDWIRGGTVESEWRPTWLDRMVYTRDEDETAGHLCKENGDREHALDLKPTPGSKEPGCPPRRPDETAELAVRQADGGLVVVYSNQRNWIGGLVEAVHARFGPLEPRKPALDELAGSVEASHADVAAYLRDGIGLHHGHLSRAARAAVETAARRRLLRCVVCTSTLLEGIDFPTRSVIAAYPPEKMGRPEIARMRNLAGRAGRGGLFTSGLFTVMTFNQSKADKWLAAFRAKLPAADSALELALRELMNATHRLGKIHAVDKVVDALLLSAFAEGAVADGDLRTVLERELGRTLWFSTTHPSEQERIFRNATVRARHVFGAVSNPQVIKAFYRSGLPLGSCMALRQAIQGQQAAITEAILDPSADHDELLIRLATQVAPTAIDPLQWHELDQGQLAGALRGWLSGRPIADLEESFATLWPKVTGNPLENLLPWVLTGIVDILAALEGRDEVRDQAHRRLGMSRLRYGVPDEALCNLVQGGHDRVRVTQLAQDVKREASAFSIAVTGLQALVEARLAADTHIRQYRASQADAPR